MSCTAQTSGTIQLVEHRDSCKDSIVQICTEVWDNGYRWRYIMAEDWTETKARAACRQLGLPHSGMLVFVQ